MKIVTDRLILEEAKISDIEDIMAMERNPQYSPYIWSGSYEEHLAEIENPNCLLIAFRNRETGAFEGFSLNYIDGKSHVFELRRIAVVQRGKGYGREAIEAIFDYAFEEENINRLWLDVYPHNKAGIGLYESLGMKIDGVLRQSYKSGDEYWDQIIYSILRDEWK